VKYKVKTPIEYTPTSAMGVPQPKEKRTRWHDIGRAWDDEGRGKKGRITVILDSMPIRSEYLYLFPDEEGSPYPDEAQRSE
jgi:hypothetical protein